MTYLLTYYLLSFIINTYLVNVLHAVQTAPEIALKNKCIYAVHIHNKM